MAKFQGIIAVDVQIQMVLTEKEALALRALAKYDNKQLMEFFGKRISLQFGPGGEHHDGLLSILVGAENLFDPLERVRDLKRHAYELNVPWDGAGRTEAAAAEREARKKLQILLREGKLPDEEPASENAQEPKRKASNPKELEELGE